MKRHSRLMRRRNDAEQCEDLRSFKNFASLSPIYTGCLINRKPSFISLVLSGSSAARSSKKP